MNALLKAVGIVGASVVVGYWSGRRQWERKETQDVVAKVVSLGSGLEDIRNWAATEGLNLDQAEFAHQLEAKLIVMRKMAQKI